MKYISLNWTLALKFSIGKKKRMRDCRILMAHDCSFRPVLCSMTVSLGSGLHISVLEVYICMSL